MKKRLSVKISGKVQGVFFRATTKREADKLGLVGWVKNEPDGAVRIETEGEETDLQKLLEWCKNGSKSAKVEKVEEDWNGEIENFTGFYIKR